MGMLGRYKKPGGFLQLIHLIETCEQDKRSHFLKMIESEDIRWARALKLKMLTLQRIFSWESEVVSSLARKVPENIIAALLYKYEEEINRHILPTYSDRHKERIMDIFDQGEPTEKEVSQASLYFIAEIRRQLLSGDFCVEKIESQLVIPVDIEDQLIRGTFQFPRAQAKIVNSPFDRQTPTRPGQSRVSEVKSQQNNQVLEAEMSQMKTENNQLKEELEELREKLSLFAYQNHRLRRENRILKEKSEDFKKSS